MSVVDPGSGVPGLRLREAFAALKPELDAMDGSDLPRIALDIHQAVVTVVGSMPEVRSLAGRVAAELPTVDPRVFEHAERAALALSYAHTQHLVASVPVVPVAELTEELKRRVEVLSADARALAKRGVIDRERLSAVPGTNGAKKTVETALMVVELVRRNWEAVVGRSAITQAELDATEVLADRLLVAMGAQEQGPTGVAETAVIRAKAYAVFLRAWDEVRRVVTFLRWREGDVDEFAPSLYAGRSRKPAEEVVERDMGVAAQAAPSPSPAPAAVNEQ